MTIERFQGVYIKDNLLKIQDNGVVKLFDNERLKELLNALVEENEELKKENNELKGNIRTIDKQRFIIDCNGIIDTWNSPNGNCNDKLTWKELCNTLNELYEENERLKKENQRMTDKIAIGGWNMRFSIQGQAIKHYGELLTLDMICEMLNDYAEENEELIEKMETILKLTEKIEDCTHDIKMITDG